MVEVRILFAVQDKYIERFKPFPGPPCWRAQSYHSRLKPRTQWTCDVWKSYLFFGLQCWFSHRAWHVAWLGIVENCHLKKEAPPDNHTSVLQGKCAKLNLTSTDCDARDVQSRSTTSMASLTIGGLERRWISNHRLVTRLSRQHALLIFHALRDLLNRTDLFIYLFYWISRPPI